MQSKPSTEPVSLLSELAQRGADYFRLTKFRLSLTVVFSALFSYGMTPAAHWNLSTLLVLGLGGFLVTASANIFNQILEAEYDKIMVRTRNRPLARGSVPVSEALVLAIAAGITGIVMLAVEFNLVAALLGIVALLSYAFVYTPLKRISSIAVLVGAFPGAMPVLIGWAAGTGSLGLEAWVLFLVQFLWQFPHFWAIAWLLHDDYSKAGFRMLPNDAGRSRYTAYMIVTYTALLIPMGLVPVMAGVSGIIAAVVMVAAGVLFLIPALRLMRTLDNRDARILMFSSFLYLPVVQIACLLDKM